MAGKYLLGAAGVALFAAASTGAAQAADVMPIVVPVVTPVVVAPVGPTVEFTLEKWVELGIYPGDGYSIDVFGSADLKITAASGWGFQLIVEDELDFAPFEVEFDVTGRVFRAMGNAEVGVYAGFGVEVPGGLDGYGFGFDFAYDSDRLTLESFVQANFNGGGFNFLDTETELTVHVNDRLDVYAGVDVETDFTGNPFLAGWAGAQLSLGALSPYATVYFSNFDGLEAELGVELEYQIGNGPLSLLGNAEVDFGFPGTRFFVAAGIRYAIGGE